MANRELDITVDTDDEIEVLVVVQPTTKDTLQQEAIDLTKPDEGHRNTTRRSKTVRAPADACVRSNGNIVDLCSTSDEDVTLISSKKSPATQKKLFRTNDPSDDVVIAESPTKTQAMSKASPNTVPRRNNSSTKKRSHTEIATSASLMVDLTDLGDEKLNRKRRPKSSDTRIVHGDPKSSNVRNHRISSAVQTICGTLTTIPPTLIATGDTSSTTGSFFKCEAHNTTGNNEVINSSVRSCVGGDENSTLPPPAYNRRIRGVSKKVHETPSIDKKATPPSSVEAASSQSHEEDNSDSEDSDTHDKNTASLSLSEVATSQSHEEDNSDSEDSDAFNKRAAPFSSSEVATSQSHEEDNSDSEDYDTSDSQSTVSLSSDTDRRKTRARNVVAPRIALRPRVGGKAIVKRRSVLNDKTTQKYDIINDYANTDNLQVKMENGNKTERPTRASNTTAKTKLLMKSSSKHLRNVPTRKSSRQLKHVVGTNESVRENSENTDEISDSEKSDAYCSGIDDDSRILSFSTLNTGKDQGKNTITLNWESLASRSTYQHYYIIDDMIMNTKKQKTDDAAVGSLPLVRAGESRFFAPRYSGHTKDLIQWVTYRQPHMRPVQPNHLSIYLPFDTVVE